MDINPIPKYKKDLIKRYQNKEISKEYFEAMMDKFEEKEMQND